MSSTKQRRSSSISIDGANRANNIRIPTTPINTPIQAHDSSSSSRSPVSLPTSPLYHMSAPGDRDGFQGDYVCMPSGTQSPQSHTPSHQPYLKQEPDSTMISFASNCINEKGRSDAQLAAQQPPCFQTPDWTGSTYQQWYRGSDLFDPSKSSPSSVIPINHQVLPYIPLCAGCQVNPALRLYPGSLLWLPQYGYTSGAPRTSSVDTVLEDEADSCMAGRHRAVMESPWDTDDLSGTRRDGHTTLDVQLGCVEDR